MARLAAIAIERGCARLDFTVLDWNPARGFYHRLGIETRAKWLLYRATDDALRALPRRMCKTAIEAPDWLRPINTPAELAVVPAGQLLRDYFSTTRFGALSPEPLGRAGAAPRASAIAAKIALTASAPSMIRNAREPSPAQLA